MESGIFPPIDSLQMAKPLCVDELDFQETQTCQLESSLIVIVLALTLPNHGQPVICP